MKLAQFTGKENGAKLFIAPQHVIGIIQDAGGGTNIMTSEGNVIVREDVCEAADRIAAAYEA